MRCLGRFQLRLTPIETNNHYRTHPRSSRFPPHCHNGILENRKANFVAMTTRGMGRITTANRSRCYGYGFVVSHTRLSVAWRLGWERGGKVPDGEDAPGAGCIAG